MNATTRQHRVTVTDHALQRWLERGAEYGDDTREDVVVAFRSAVEVPYTMIPRVSWYVGKIGTSDRYYRLDRPGFPTVWFVADRSGEVTTIITVLHDTRNMAPASATTCDSQPDIDQLVREQTVIVKCLCEEAEKMNRGVKRGKVCMLRDQEMSKLNKLLKKQSLEYAKKKQNSG